jgi:hypothetical protein
MRSSWNLTRDPAVLDAFARVQIEYEVRMLLQQFGLLERRWRDVQKRRRRSPDAVIGADGQALLEAVLVHLRLLDDFLGHASQDKTPNPPHDQDDVFARHWDDPSGSPWTRSGFLDSERDRVNAKVAHLTGRRLTVPDVQPDDIPPLVLGCCERLNEFFDHVDAHSHARVAAFELPRRRVEQCLAGDPAAFK